MATARVVPKADSPIRFSEYLKGNFFKDVKTNKVYYKMTEEVITDIRTGVPSLVEDFDREIMPVSIIYKNG